MTFEEKKEALRNAAKKVWKEDFCYCDMVQSEDNPNVFLLGSKSRKDGYLAFLDGCRDIPGGFLWIEYEPKEDLVALYIKDRPVQEKFKEDIVNLFEKHSPLNMKVYFEEESTPIISYKEKVLPEAFEQFFVRFREAYDEYYPLFYMVTVSAKEWYDGFHIEMEFYSTKE